VEKYEEDVRSDLEFPKRIKVEKRSIEGIYFILALLQSNWAASSIIVGWAARDTLFLSIR